MSVSASVLNYDLKNAVSKNRLVGLWRMMSGYRWHYLGATIALGISAFSQTATALLLNFFVDTYLTAGERPYPLYFVGLGFIGLALIQGLLSFTSGRLSAQTAEGSTRRLRNYLFDHIQHLPYSYHRKTQTGELIQRCTSDVDAVRRFFADQAIGVGRIVLLFVINFTAIALINLKLALLSIIAVPIIVITSFIFFRRVSKAYESFQEQDAILTTTLQENLTGVRVVKAFARQEHEINKFDRDNKEKYTRGRRLLLMHTFFWPISDVVCGLQMVVGYIVGATLTINGTITLGNYVAYLGLITWIIWPMRNLGRLIVQGSTGMVSFNRVMDIIKEVREPLDEGDYLPKDSTCQRRSNFQRCQLQVRRRQRTGCKGHQLSPAYPASRYPYSAPPDRARPRWSTSCPASLNIPAGSSPWTASISSAIRAGSCAARSASSSKSHSSSRAPSARTSPTASGVMSPWKKSKPLPAQLPFTTSSPPSPRGTTPWWVKKASPSPEAKSSAWPLPAPCSKTRASSSWMTPPPQ